MKRKDPRSITKKMYEDGSARVEGGLFVDAETGKYRPRKKIRYRPGRESAPPRRKR